ncbi:MAG: hypothetical protein AB8G05_23175 [Oligoflexales bacterium]
MFEIVTTFKDEMLSEDIKKGQPETIGIWLQDELNCYPQTDWLDNGLILLSWWTVTWQSLANSQPNQGISFMEGPYLLVAEQDLNGNIILSDIKNNINFKISLEDFGKQLRKAINKVIRHFQSLNLRSDNLDALPKCLNIIDSELKKLKAT